MQALQIQTPINIKTKCLGVVWLRQGYVIRIQLKSRPHRWVILGTFTVLFLHYDDKFTLQYLEYWRFAIHANSFEPTYDLFIIVLISALI